MNTVQGTREYLLKYDIKPSMQRIAIMDYLMTHRVHPTADEIYNALYPTMPTLSKTTIYNTMKLFSEQGAVKALVIDEKNVRFDIDTSSHAHFMCLGCGCVYDLPIENQEAIQFIFITRGIVKNAPKRTEKTYYYNIKKVRYEKIYLYRMWLRA